MTNPIRLRASSVASLLDCSLRWEKQNLRGMRLPSSPPAAVGTAVHASTAAYDQGQLDGSGLSIDDTAGIAVDSLRSPDEDVDWAGTQVAKAEERAIRTHIAYCQEIAPTQNYTLVERTLPNLTIDMGDGVVFELTGTLDRVREDEYGNKGVADVKTGIAAVGADGSVAVGKHLAQLGTYTILAEQELGPLTLDSAIIGLSTGGKARVGIREVAGAKAALVGEWGSPGILQYVAPMFKSGLFMPNAQSWLCSPKFCPFYKGCRFHG